MQAQANEYIFDILRRNGIAANMDVTIGSDFFDMSKVSSELQDTEEDEEEPWSGPSVFARMSTHGSHYHRSSSYQKEAQFREALQGHIQQITTDYDEAESEEGKRWSVNHH